VEEDAYEGNPIWVLFPQLRNLFAVCAATREDTDRGGLYVE
jgi:hypothetical protein